MDFELLKFTPKSKKNISKQLFNFIVSEIKKNNLKNGDKLPSIRNMAKYNNLTKGIVEEAYNLLKIHSFIDSKPGYGFIVNSSQSRDCSYSLYNKQNIILDISELTNIFDKYKLQNMCSKIYKDISIDASYVNFKKNQFYELYKKLQILVSIYIYSNKRIHVEPKNIILFPNYSMALSYLQYCLDNNINVAVKDPSSIFFKDQLKKLNINFHCYDNLKQIGFSNNVLNVQPFANFPDCAKLDDMGIDIITQFTQNNNKYILETDFNLEFIYEIDNNISLYNLLENKVFILSSFFQLLTNNFNLTYLVVPSKFIPKNTNMNIDLFSLLFYVNGLENGHIQNYALNLYRMLKNNRAKLKYQLENYNINYIDPSCGNYLLLDFGLKNIHYLLRLISAGFKAYNISQFYTKNKYDNRILLDFSNTKKLNIKTILNDIF